MEYEPNASLRFQLFYEIVIRYSHHFKAILSQGLFASPVKKHKEISLSGYSWKSTIFF